MTECERIIKDGILPESFFEEDVQAGFLVSRERKKIWAIGIDILVKFDAICRKHGLQYSLAFGSLLGCIRHHGFIPWDDDIDIVMPRVDYERLKEYKGEFEQPYFIQFPGEDEGYFFSFAKVRNSNTTGVSIPFRYESFNQGLFMDIFPLDNYDAFNIEEDIEKIRSLVAESSALMRKSNPFPDEIDEKKMSQFPVIRKGEVITQQLDKLLKQHLDKPSDRYIIWSCLTYNYKKTLYPKTIIDNLIETDFYGHQVFIPKNFDDVLRITYGDYMQYPPIESRGTWHNKNMFNADIPYHTTIIELRKKDMV